MSDSVWPRRLKPTRLLSPWDFPGKSTGVGCHCLLRKGWIIFHYIPWMNFKKIHSSFDWHLGCFPFGLFWIMLWCIWVYKYLFESLLSFWGIYTGMGFPGSASGKEPACQCRRPGFHPWVGKIPWRRAWQPTPVFLPGEFRVQRSLADYSP